MKKLLLVMAALVALVSANAADCNCCKPEADSIKIGTGLTLTSDPVYSSYSLWEPKPTPDEVKYSWAQTFEWNRRCFAKIENYSIRELPSSRYQVLVWDNRDTPWDATGNRQETFAFMWQAKDYAKAMAAFYESRLNGKIVWGRTK